MKHKPGWSENLGGRCSRELDEQEATDALAALGGQVWRIRCQTTAMVSGFVHSDDILS